MPKYQKKHTGLIIAVVAFAVFAYSIQQAMPKISMQTMSRISASSVNISDDTDTTYIHQDPTEPEPEPTIEPDPPASDDASTTHDNLTTQENNTTNETYVSPSDDVSTQDHSFSTDSTTSAGDDGSTSNSDSLDWAATSIYNPETKTTTQEHHRQQQKEEDFVDVANPQHVAKTKEYMKNFVARDEAVEIFKKREEQLTQQEKEKKETFKQQATKDTDGDGIPDREEHRIGTNIFSADSDNDGFKDGDEVKSGFNPLVRSDGDKGDRVRYQDPETVKEKSEVYRVKKADLKQGSQQDGDQLELSGQALPGSIVTLYIYSDPVVVTVVADSDGGWSYVLHKELEEGEHKVYAAVTDSTGKVTERSEGFTFVKTAQALAQTEQEKTPAPQPAVSPVKEAQSNMTIVWLAIAGVSILLALFSIGYFIKHHRDKEGKKGSEEKPQEKPETEGQEMKQETQEAQETQE